MCGIVGYTGYENAEGIIVDGLKRLEYRGYDSAGIAVLTDKGLQVRKKKQMGNPRIAVRCKRPPSPEHGR